MLTDFKIHQAKATGKKYALSDSDGMRSGSTTAD
jgi:hypothetical protein